MYFHDDFENNFILKAIQGISKCIVNDSCSRIYKVVQAYLNKIVENLFFDQYF